MEGDQLWYVTSRGEVKCLDTEGFHDGENDGPFINETTDSKSEADVVWVFNMMTELGVSQHNMCSCSVTGASNLLFVNTSNGVDEVTHQPASQTLRALYVLMLEMAKSYGRMLRLMQMSFTVNGQVPDTQKLTGYRKSFLAVVTAGFMALMHVEMETVAQNSFGNLITNSERVYIFAGWTCRPKPYHRNTSFSQGTRLHSCW